MTTIAISTTMIAADSRATRGNELRAHETKIRPAHERLYAISGCAALLPLLIDWHNTGADPNTMPDKGNKDQRTTLIVVDPKAEHPMSFSTDCPYPEWVDLPSTFGSGSSYAQALLDAGFSAIEAVAGAAKRDIYTGGPIIAYDLTTLQPVDYAVCIRDAAE